MIPCSPNARWLGWAMVTSLGAWNTAAAQIAPPGGRPPESATAESDAPADAAKIQGWVEQLGAASFQERERATAALLRVGVAAVPILRAVEKQDLERWTRARQIAEKIEREQFEQLSKSFLLDADPQNSYGLPIWSLYAERVGTSRTAKLLFLEMLRQEPELVERIGAVWRAQRQNLDSEPLVDALQGFLALRAAEIWQDRMHMRVPEMGQFVALLLGVSMLPDKAPAEVNALMEASINMVPFSSYLNRRGYTDAVRRLLALWIPKSQASQSEIVLSIALRYDLATGVDVARQNLGPSLDARVRQLAILNLVRFGGSADIPLLVPCMSDRVICEAYQVNPSGLSGSLDVEERPETPPGFPQPPLALQGPAVQFKILRLCDLALAAALVLKGDDPRTLFPDFEPHSVYGIDGASIAIAPDPGLLEQRDQQIAQWLQAYQTHRKES